MWKSKKDTNEVTIITPPKSINYDTMEEFKKLIQALAAKGESKTVLNMKQAIYIDSSGLGMLVKAAADMRGEGGDLKLAHVNAGIADVIRITNLNKVFKIYEDMESAIKSYE